MAGTVAVFVLLFGPYFLLLSPLIVLAGGVCWQVRAYMQSQALAGTILAIGVTIGTFWVFRVF
jgi:hypothetical protein